MRLLTFFILISLILSCTAPKNIQSNKLNGVWIPVKEEIAGKELPPAAFQGQKLTLDGNNYTFVAESVDKGTVERKADTMDIYGKEGVNAGKHFTAIYKLENGELSICYNLTGDSYPEAFTTKGKATLFLCVFKKQ